MVQRPVLELEEVRVELWFVVVGFFFVVVGHAVVFVVEHQHRLLGIFGVLRIFVVGELGHVMRVALAALVLAGCATAQITVPPTDVADLERSLRGDSRFLRVSMHVTPFYGDQTRKLLTPVDPELVRYLNDASGKPLNPGPAEATFAAGTAVRIMKVEFPSGWTMAERVLYTPRSLVWVYVDVAGRSANAPPAVLVMRPGIKTRDEFNTELERLLTRQDPALRIEGFSDAVRTAVKAKKAVKDMPAEALEMAWGYPESKRVEMVDGQRQETWYWGDKAREAKLVDGRLVSFSGANAASSSSSP